MAFPTLSVNPDYPIVEGRIDDVIKSPSEAGYEHRRPRYTHVIRTFKLRYPRLTNGDKTTLETYVGTVRGAADSFTWTHPISGSNYTVRFEALPEFSAVAYGLWSTDFSLREA